MFIGSLLRGTLCSVPFMLVPLEFHGQCDGWQQRVEYTMQVSLDENSHMYNGSSKLIYWNNSPDTLREVFFHLYFNAFRPGSEMDVRSRTIIDPDTRIGDRIAKLSPEEMGRLTMGVFTQDGKPATMEHMGTVLKVTLAKPLLPNKSTTFNYTFNGQVPIQIRRSGRNNSEGVAYSMAQWYPKLAEYDLRGWHADPYVGREFFGVWGDFDVTLELDSAFTVASTGVLQNPSAIGHGYSLGSKPLKRPAGEKLKWHFKAEDVHDFAWVADKTYIHTTEQVPDGPLLHFFRKDDPDTKEVWDQLPGYMVRCFQYMNAHFGTYPWPQFSFAQGGDGGMEYPMLTLILGKRRLGGVVGTSVHESIHSWYYGALASNEGQYPWMDEGFTEYAGSCVMQELFPKPDEDPHASSITGYRSMVNSGKHEPASIHADHFKTNKAYSNTAYSFGEMFVYQLGAVVGEKNVEQGLVRYFETCKFKHPGPVDFERVMEKQSGLELDWYFNEWINTTRTLDMGIRSVMGVNGGIRIELERIGDQLMPVDLRLVLRDGRILDHHIPLSLSLGSKNDGSEHFEFSLLPVWQWTNPTYSLDLPVPFSELRAVSIDPLQRTADMDLLNNMVEFPEGAEGFAKP